MGMSDYLKAAGYKPAKSTGGDKPILKGVYKCLFVDFENQPDGKFGPQLMAKFKVVERLSGSESRSTFPEFTGYYKADGENAASLRSGVAKLFNGFFSVGLSIDSSTDEAITESLNKFKGSAEVYIKGYEKKPRKEVNGEWVDNPDGDIKQDFTFMTEKNAAKEAEKQIKKDGHPL